jgi:FkbM family methyltransferase
VSALLRLVRRLATAPGFRRLSVFTPLLRVSFALRGTLVRSPLRFALNELRPGTITAAYRLRDSDVSIVVRHHTPDVLVLDEIFSQREYELPCAVEQALETRSRPLTILDLGANIGLFGALMLARFADAHIVAIEADPENAAIHARAIEANGNENRWTLIRAAAATAPGTARFSAGGFALSHAIRDREAGIEVPAVDVLPRIVDADFVKIDIEGAEWPLLADDRFAQTRALALVLEYHRQGCPGTDPKAEAERAFVAAGFEVEHGATKPQFGAGILWAWRQRQAQSKP